MSRRKNESFYKENSERMSYMRNSLGMTQAEFAQAIGIKHNIIRDIEAGKSLTSTDLALSIEEIFYFSFKWILTGAGEIKTGVNSKTQEQVIKITGPVQKHMEAVRNFEDHEAALEINNDLIIIEKNSKPLFEKAKTYISGMKDASIVFNDVKKTGQITKQLDGSQERRRKKAV